VSDRVVGVTDEPSNKLGNDPFGRKLWEACWKHGQHLVDNGKVRNPTRGSKIVWPAR
jgi:hypothetical protein